MMSTCLFGPALAGCSHYPKGRVAKVSGVAPQVPSITIAAYGDTRTGPWGLGDNAKQAIHGKVVDDIFANIGSVDLGELARSRKPSSKSAAGDGLDPDDLRLITTVIVQAGERPTRML
jgi:hypothetical protein